MLTAALLALLLFSPQASPELDAALKALDADQPAVAEALLRKVVAATPGDYFAHFNLGLALSMQVKDAEAIAEFRTTLVQKPGLYEAELNLGMVLLRAKQPAEAASVLKDAVAARADDPVAHYYYADSLLQTGDAAQALEQFRTVATADPKSARAQFGMGRSLARLGKLTEAEPYYRTAAALDLDYRDQLLALAGEYEKAGQTDRAIAIYREFPDKPYAQGRLAELTTVKPSEYDLALNRARELREQHKPDEAIQQFLAAARLKPSAPEPWREIAAILISAKNYAKGLEALDRAKALAPEQAGELFFRAISFDGLHQRKPAVDAYSQFLAAAQGKFPDQEFQARQRIRIIEEELKRGAR